MGLSTPDRAVALTHRTHTYTTGSRVRVVSALLLPLNSEAGAKAGGVYPPYLLRTGSDHLYLGHKGFDHEALHDVMQAVKVPWMLSYKDHPEIRRLYAGHIIETVKFPYTTSPGQAGEKREKVSELLILSKRL